MEELRESKKKKKWHSLDRILTFKVSAVCQRVVYLVIFRLSGGVCSESRIIILLTILKYRPPVLVTLLSINLDPT